MNSVEKPCLPLEWRKQSKEIMSTNFIEDGREETI